ncbi:hypothetical protein Acid345_1643 [Candidatus Koribacter versatilis Ellin345]|uniref:Uncharacterized protein n=1 Tax=Koribacter versatilis (strain Ellin345) TaxID=204669 RepID=Q1IR55_KORVE|nr:hypothetical protein Acid345_1643 [Candidatus Koribacter versatilis Ellin345]
MKAGTAILIEDAHWFTTLSRAASGVWSNLRQHIRREPRKLRLEETLALGDRRFVAIVNCENNRFLIGGGANSVALLSPLSDAIAFREVLKRIHPDGSVR